MMFDNITSVMIPVLFHFFVSYVTSVFGYGKFDAAFLTSLTALLVLPVFSWMFYKDLRKYGLEHGKRSGWTYLLIIMLAVGSNQLFSWIINLIMQGSNLSNEVQESLFGSALWAQIVGVGILVPFMEEILFRGLVYKRLKSFLNRRAAVIFAALLFALYHGNLYQFLFALPMSLLLIFVYEKWGTIKAPIVFHMAVNLSSVLLTAFL